MARLRYSVLALLPLSLAGCGAGLVAGGLLGSGGDDSTTPAPPTVALAQDAGPLIIDPGESYVRRATLQNVTIPNDQAIDVRLVWDRGGDVIESVQQSPQIVRSGGPPVLSFTLNTTEIAAAVADPFSEDVDARLVISSTDTGSRVELVSTPFRLLRRATATLVPSSGNVSIVPASGGVITLNVRSLPTIDPVEIALEVETLDPTGAEPSIVRQATNLRLADLGGGVAELRGTIPPSTFPTDATLRVIHDLSGRTAPIDGVFYEPVLTAAVSRRGGTEGNDVISLEGQALVPFRFTGNGPAELDFSRVEIAFMKDGQTTTVGRSGLRPSLSSLNNVVFVTPPSPDGLPGEAGIELRVAVPNAVLTVSQQGLFSFGAPFPTFEPRGVTLRETPKTTVFGPLRRADLGASTPDDAAVVFEDGLSVPFAQVYEGRGNGMFSRVGVSIRAGSRGNLEQRRPTAALIDDFDGDRAGDLLVVNLGEGSGQHTALFGNPAKFGSFAAPTVFFASPPPTFSALARGADFNSDGRSDVFLLSSDPLARLDTSQFLLSRQIGPHVPVATSPLNTEEFSRACVEDWDGDGNLDLVLAGGRGSAHVAISYGTGTGAFVDRSEFLLDDQLVPTGSTIVGVHPGGRAGDPRSIVLVLSDAPGAQSTDFLVFQPTGTRSYSLASVRRDSYSLLAPTHTVSGDFDGDGFQELVVGSVGRLTVFAWNRAAETFAPVAGAVDLQSVRVGTITELNFGVAVPVRPGQPEVRAVYMTHEFTLQPVTERRITVLLVGPGTTLVEPTAEYRAPKSVVNLAYGRFNGDTPSVAVTYDDESVALLEPDGIGGFGDAIVPSISVPGVLADTVTSVPRDAETLTPAFQVGLFDDGKVGLIRYDQLSITRSTESLLDYLGPGASGATILPESRIESTDVDADGRRDLVVLLVARLQGGGERSLVMVLRGRPPSSPEPFPFFTPHPSVEQATIDVAASSLTVGNFGPDPTDLLEAAIAVPNQAGSEPGVHFFHYLPGDPTDARDDRMMRTAVGPVAELLDPVMVATTDLDANGLDDLLVASESGETLHFFRQDLLPGGGTLPDPRAFTISAEPPLPPGKPLRVDILDFDGDSIKDIMIKVLEPGVNGRHFIGGFLTNGFGGLRGSFLLPEHRVDESLIAPRAHGSRLSTTVGDTNGDGVADLILSWDGPSPGQPSFVRSLFGSYR